MFVFDVVSVLVQLSAARQGSPLNNLQLSSSFFLPKPSSHPFFPTSPWPPPPHVKRGLSSSWAFCALSLDLWLVFGRYLWMLCSHPGPRRTDCAEVFVHGNRRPWLCSWCQTPRSACWWWVLPEEVGPRGAQLQPLPHCIAPLWGLLLQPKLQTC